MGTELEIISQQLIQSCICSICLTECDNVHSDSTLTLKKGQYELLPRQDAGMAVLNTTRERDEN